MPKLKYTRRSDGRLQAQIYIGSDSSGKKKYKYVYARTQKELQEKINENKILVGKGIDLAAQNDTFGYWGQKWLKFKRSEVSASYYPVLEVNYKKLQSLYNIPIPKIHAADLRDILTELCCRNYSRSTVKKIKNIAVGVIDFAVENRVIEHNVLRNTPLPKYTKPEETRRALTDEEQRWIIDTPHRAQTAAMIMMFAGLRRGELIPLQWSDIDFAAGTISVTKSVEMIDGRPQVKKGGKTYAATRTVYIPAILRDYLQSIAKSKSSLLVCPSASGKMISNSAWRRLWDGYLCDLNFKYGDFDSYLGGKPKSKYQPGGVPFVIPRFTAHWLRHTFITTMYLSGVDLMTAKEQAGHADIHVTMQIYTHLDSVYKKKSIEKLDSYLREKYG